MSMSCSVEACIHEVSILLVFLHSNKSSFLNIVNYVSPVGRWSVRGD